MFPSSKGKKVAQAVIAPPVGELVETSQKLTLESFRNLLPLDMRVHVTKKLVDVVNNLDQEDINKSFKDDLVRFADVLTDGHFQVKQYVNAVRYVGYKLSGVVTHEAYRRVFPDRYARLVSEGATAKDIRIHARSYQKGKLVTKIIEHAMVPVYLVNCDLVQEAINKQAVLMRTAKSETVQQKAAESLMVNLKPPESIDINISADSSSQQLMAELKETTRLLAIQQKELISGGGASAKQIAMSNITEKEEFEEIVEAEYEEMVLTPKEKAICKLNP